MKKIFTWIFNLTNPTPEERAAFLFRFLCFKSTSEHQIVAFETLKKSLYKELEQKEKEALKEFNLINSYLPKKKSISRIDINDPIFEQPLKN